MNQALTALRTTVTTLSMAFVAATFSASAMSAPITSSHPPGWQKGIDFNSLPLDKAIVRVKGSGERKIALIVDPSCPYSRKQEQELESVDNVTIYTFVENILEQPLGREFSQLVKCQNGNEAKAKAWENWILNGERPPAAAACQAPTIKADLGNLETPYGKLYAQVSPVIIFESGITGATLVKADEIEEVLNVTFD